MERCIVCEEEKKLGIHLYMLFICTDCEYDIVHTEPGEEMYDYYIQKLKSAHRSHLTHKTV